MMMAKPTDAQHTIMPEKAKSDNRAMQAALTATQRHADVVAA